MDASSTGLQLIGVPLTEQLAGGFCLSGPVKLAPGGLGSNLLEGPVQVSVDHQCLLIEGRSSRWSLSCPCQFVHSGCSLNQVFASSTYDVLEATMHYPRGAGDPRLKVVFALANGEVGNPLAELCTQSNGVYTFGLGLHDKKGVIPLEEPGPVLCCGPKMFSDLFGVILALCILLIIAAIVYFSCFDK